MTICFIKILFLAVSILCFTNCAKIPDEATLFSKLDLPKEFSNQKNINEKHAIKLSADYKKTFFLLFQDKKLHDLASKALMENANLKILESNIRQARASAKINTWNLLPKVNAGIHYNYSDNNYKKIQTTVTQNTINANMSFSWEADIFGKNNALRLAGKQKVLESLANLNAAQVVLLGDVANYYFLLRQGKQSIAINQEIVKNLQEIVVLLEYKYNLGLIELDVLATAKENLLIQENTLLNLFYLFEQNKNALLVLLNIKDLDAMYFEEDYDFQIIKIPNINGMPNQIIFNRFDVHSSVFALYAAIYQRHNKKMALFPVISLSGNLGQILFSPRGSAFDLVWQVAGSLVAPIFNRQTLTQDYLIAKESTKQAFYTLQNTVNVALGEIENALKNVDVTLQSLSNAQENYAFNKQSYKIIESRHQEQLIDELARLEYANIYLRSKINLLDSYVSQNQAVIALYKAFGGSFMANVFEDLNLEDQLQQILQEKDQKLF